MPELQALIPAVSYADSLSAAWRDAQAPRSADAPTVVSLFAGCGGSSLGYRMAGYKVLLAAEWDDHAVSTYKLNFPGTPVYHGDVSALSVDDALKLAGLSAPGELDVLDGSPPCQGFSTAGRRQIDDPRNSLFKEYVRLLRGLQPRAFVMENVSGMVKGKMRLVFAECLRELKASGYAVACRLMNTKWFGVPQSRERVIFIGTRADLALAPSHPAARTLPISCATALIGLLPNEAARGMLLASARIKGAYRGWHRIALGGTAADLPEENGSRFNAVKYNPIKPARTIFKSDGNIGLQGGMHWEEPRRFTAEEYKRFASFPDEYAFPGDIALLKDWGAAVSRIGNSVPPLLMRAIAEHVRRLLRAPQPVRVGDTSSAAIM